MTDTQAPDRIWAVTEPDDVSAQTMGEVYAQQVPDGMVGQPIPYTRTDIYTSALARIEELEAALKDARSSALRDAAALISAQIEKKQPAMTREAQQLSDAKKPSIRYALKRADLDARISCRDQVLSLIDKLAP